MATAAKVTIAIMLQHVTQRSISGANGRLNQLPGDEYGGRVTPKTLLRHGNALAFVDLHIA
jgi:hypothetical protein